jgi:hypothetical protein
VRPALHEAVRSVIPSARFAYADRDPVAAAHVRALQASGEGLAAAEGDLADPAAILADPAVRDVIDLSRPAGVVLGAVLHLWDAGRAEKIVQGYVSRVAAGSWVIVSAAWYRPEAAGTLAALRREYAPGVFFNHSPADVAGFLAGLQVAEPGIASAGRWVSGEGGTAGRPSTMLAAVGIKRLLSVTGLAYGDFPGSGEGRFQPQVTFTVTAWFFPYDKVTVPEPGNIISGGSTLTWMSAVPPGWRPPWSSLSVMPGVALADQMTGPPRAVTVICSIPLAPMCRPPGCCGTSSVPGSACSGDGDGDGPGLGGGDGWEEDGGGVTTMTGVAACLPGLR